MKKIILIVAMSFIFQNVTAQKGSDFLIPTGIAALSFVAANAEKKEVAKEISQFRSKEYIVKYIIGASKGKEIKFETESLASDDSAGLISVAFNCTEVNERGLLLAFFGNNKDANGNVVSAYGFRYIPLAAAQDLLRKINSVKENNKKYLAADDDVNNIYFEYEDIKFIIYKDFGDKVRVLWNGFEVIWEKTAFDRTKRRLDKWFS
jgi:hypothetical protein